MNKDEILKILKEIDELAKCDHFYFEDDYFKEIAQNSIKGIIEKSEYLINKIECGE